MSDSELLDEDVLQAMSEERARQEASKKKGRRWSLDTIAPRFWKRSQPIVEANGSRAILPRGSLPSISVINEESLASPGNRLKIQSREVYAVLYLDDGDHKVLTGQDESDLKQVIEVAAMEYRISSYRVIVASTKSVLHLCEPSNLTHSHSESILRVPSCSIEVTDFEDPRFKIVDELLQSEQEYCDQLRSLFEGYAEPLRKFSSLNKDDHRILFMGIEPVISMSAMITSKLQYVLQTWDPISSKVGNLFSNKFWNQYSEYQDNFADIKRFLDEKLKSDSAFSEFCELRKNQGGRLSLDSLLYLPIDRIAKYDEYLNDLLNKTNATQPDFDDLYKASKRVNAMVREREDEIRDALNGQTVESVQDRFPNDDLHLCEQEKAQKTRGVSPRRKSAPSAVLFKSLGGSRNQNTMGKKDYEVCNSFRHSTDANRMYVMEGPVQFANDTQTQHYMFLFNDLLLIAKQKSNTTFKLKHRIQVCDLWIANCIEEVTETTKLHDRSFVIGWPTKNIVAIFKDPETKDLWLLKLTEQIQEEKCKEEGKTIQLKIVHRKNDMVKTCFIPVNNTNDVKDVLKLCMEQFQIPETEQKDYQLWVLTGSKDTVYPLIGHEIPYSIKVRTGGDGDGQTVSDMEAITNSNSKCEFFLKHKKSTNKRGQDYASHGNNKRHRRPAILQIFHRRGREEKTSSVVPATPTGKLFGHPLSSVCTEGDNPAKVVLDMLRILYRKGPYTTGIMRKGANYREVRNLREKLDKGDPVDMEGYCPLIVGSTFKEYLRSIPKSLLVDDLIPEWTKMGNMENNIEKLEKTKQLIQQLPNPNLILLKFVMCMLYQILKNSEGNRMDCFNLAVCIAPSLLFSSEEPPQMIMDPSSVITPRAPIEFIIDNTRDLFGDDITYMLADQLDSGTDSDSMNSVLNGLRRDDSSIDSLVDRDLYSGEVDSSPKLANSHLSPSNLSRDSGLTLSDSQLNDDECDIDSGDRKFIRSASDYDDYSHSFESTSLNPVPPPRSRRKKGLDSMANSFENYHQAHVASMQPMFTGSRTDKQQKFSLSLQPEMLRSMQFGKRMSSDSLQSVEENEENDSKDSAFLHHRRPIDMGLLVKSASGSHLYLNNDEIYSRRSLSVEGQQNQPPRDRLVRQSSVTDSTPPLSPESKYSYSSSHDSVISDSSAFSRDYSVHSLPETPEEFPNDKYLGTWDIQNRERSNSNPVQIHTSASCSEVQSASHLSANYGGYNLKSMENMRYLVSPPHSPLSDRQSKSTTNLEDLSVRSCYSQTQHEVSVKKEMASPQISITCCSSGSDEQLEDELDGQSRRTKTIPLEIPGSSSPKDISMFDLGLRSPPPHIVLKSLAHNQIMRKSSAPTPVSQNQTPVARIHRNSLDSSQDNIESMDDQDVTLTIGSPRSRSISLQRSDAHNYDAECKELKSDVSPPKLGDVLSSSPDPRPAKPPSYNQALQRKFLIENGLNFEIPDQVSQRQKEASSRARQLYESSLQQYLSGENVGTKYASEGVNTKGVDTKYSSDTISSKYSSENTVSTKYSCLENTKQTVKMEQSVEEQHRDSPVVEQCRESQHVIKYSTDSPAVEQCRESQHVVKYSTDSPVNQSSNVRKQNVPTESIESNFDSSLQTVETEDEYVVLLKDPKQLYADSMRMFEQQNEQPTKRNGLFEQNEQTKRNGMFEHNEQTKRNGLFEHNEQTKRNGMFEHNEQTKRNGMFEQQNEQPTRKICLTTNLSQRDLPSSGASSGVSYVISGHPHDKTSLSAESSDRIRKTFSVPNVNLQRSKSDSAGHMPKLSTFGFRDRFSHKDYEEQKENVQSMTNTSSQHLSPKKTYFYQPEEDGERVRSVSSVRDRTPMSQLGVSEGKTVSVSSSCTISTQKAGVCETTKVSQVAMSEGRAVSVPQSCTNATQKTGVRDTTQLSQISVREGRKLSVPSSYTMSSQKTTGVRDTTRVSKINVSEGRTVSVPQSCTASTQKTTVTVTMGNSSQSRNKPARKNSELPWSVSKLKNMFDSEPQSESMSSTHFYSPDETSKNNVSSVTSSSRPAPPPYVSPPPFRRLHDNSRMSTSSSSSAGSSSVGCNSTVKSKSSRHFGPQCFDYGSFSSSSEDLETVCCRLTRCESMDNSDHDIEVYTDVSYV